VRASGSGSTHESGYSRRPLKEREGAGVTDTFFTNSKKSQRSPQVKGKGRDSNRIRGPLHLEKKNVYKLLHGEGSLGRPAGKGEAMNTKVR